VIPGNDDGMRSIDVIMRELCLAVAEGKQQRGGAPSGRAAEGAPADGGPRRSRRAQFRSDDAGAAPEGDGAVATKAE
jgi:small subunit ribosomal protein S2